MKKKLFALILAVCMLLPLEAALAAVPSDSGATVTTEETKPVVTVITPVTDPTNPDAATTVTEDMGKSLEAAAASALNISASDAAGQIKLNTISSFNVKLRSSVRGRHRLTFRVPASANNLPVYLVQRLADGTVRVYEGIVKGGNLRVMLDCNNAQVASYWIGQVLDAQGNPVALETTGK